MHPDVKEILLNEEQIASRVAELGAQISADYNGEEVIAVCALNGAMPFTCDLVRKMDGNIILDSIGASSYGNSTKSSGEVKITKELKQNVAGRHVLIIDDIFDSGLTLSLLVKLMEERGAKSVKSCVFLEKQISRGLPIALIILAMKFQMHLSSVMGWIMQRSIVSFHISASSNRKQ